MTVTTPHPFPPCVSCGVPRLSRDEAPFPGARRNGGAGRCEVCARRVERAARKPAPVVPPAPSTEWTEDASCRETDPEVFFSDDWRELEAARDICVECPVRAECLRYALATKQKFGVWGGLTVREREAIRTGTESAKRRAQRKQAAS